MQEYETLGHITEMGIEKVEGTNTLYLITAYDELKASLLNWTVIERYFAHRVITVEWADY